jgi:hypothetical protein
VAAALAWAGSLALPAGRAGAGPRVRLGLVLPGGRADESLQRGAALAEEEAAQRAARLGGAFELERSRAPVHEAAARLARREVFALLLGCAGDAAAAGADVAAGVPRLALLPSRRAATAGVLQLATPLPRRVEALVSCAAASGERRWLLAPSLCGSAAEEALTAALERHGGERVAEPERAQRWLASPEPAAAAELLAPARAAFTGAPARRVTGAIWTADWDPRLTRDGAEQLNQRFRQRFEVDMDEAAWCGWFGVKICAEAALRVGPGAAAAALLRSRSFAGHKGVPLAFAASGELLQPLYLLCVDGEGRAALTHELPAEVLPAAHAERRCPDRG